VIPPTDTLKELEARLKQWDESEGMDFISRIGLLIDYVNSKADDAPALPQYLKDLRNVLETRYTERLGLENTHSKFLMELFLNIGIEIGKLQVVDHLRVSSAKLTERFPEK